MSLARSIGLKARSVVSEYYAPWPPFSLVEHQKPCIASYDPLSVYSHQGQSGNMQVVKELGFFHDCVQRNINIKMAKATQLQGTLKKTEFA